MESFIRSIFYACMKHLFVTILLFAHCQAAWAQTDPGRRLLETKSKTHPYYVDLQDTTAMVYALGYNWNFRSFGQTIANADTLQKQPDSSYSGRYFRIIREKDRQYLLPMTGKKKKLQLNAASDTNLVNNRLNNAWHLDSYFMMCKRLDKRYPLNYLDRRVAYTTWFKLPEDEKNMPYLQFRVLADKRIKEMGDSISAIQEQYVRLTNDILENFSSWDYAALKNNLAQLPAVYMYPSRYYGTVIDTVILRRPEYFFRLAEDLPQHRSVIFYYGTDNRHTFSELMRVEGHDEAKRGLLKARRDERLSAYYAIGSTLVSVGLVTLLAIVIF
jgi:hypothetical protein